ncbi:MAG: asparagine--tRNA ligase [Elusimicrobiaceae bacterium]
MAMPAFIKDLAQHEGTEVSLKGWVNNIRSSGKIAFIELRDGTGYVQAVAVLDSIGTECADAIRALSQETSVAVTGKVSKHPKRANEYELQLTGVSAYQISEEYPLSKKAHGPDFLLENRHLWLRSKRQWAIQKIRNTAINAIYEFLNGENFTKIDCPIITSTACEGTTTLFDFEYFDLGKAYLSQSGQLYLEAAIFAHGRCFDFGPVFRAEKSKTKKHLTEFWMMDAEMAYVEHAQNMEIQERMIKFVFKAVLEKHQAELKMLERDTVPLQRVIDKPFVKMTHAQAVELLRSLGSEITPDLDLGANDERLLAQAYDVPVFIEKWPVKIKAFYMKRDPSDPDLVLGSDLMATEGFGEICGGSQREDDYRLLLSRMEGEHLNIEAFRWYLDLRKYGSVPHSGFGIGLERLVNWLTGAEHIRETIPFPRMITRFYP